MKRYTKRSFARELVLVAAALVYLAPLYLLVTMSLKKTSQVFTNPLAPPSSPQFNNYSIAWNGGITVTVGRGLLNSLVITGITVVLLIALAAPAGYAIARHASRFGATVHALFAVAIILPAQLGILPLFVLASHLHLTGSYSGMIILYVGFLMPLAVFMYTGFARAMPREYEESARVDGARESRIFVRVIFPLLRPITGTVAILTGLLIWNDLFAPLIFLGGTRKQPLPVVIYSFVGDFSTPWNIVFASVVISVAPVVAFFFFAQRPLMRGFAGGIKG